MNNKLEVLSQKMRNEKALLGDQLSPQSLQQVIDEARAVLVIQGDEIIAFGALWHREQSIELGSMWVEAKYRGQKLSSLVFAGLVTLAPIDRPLFLITHNPCVVHLALKSMMHEANQVNWKMVVPWSASCGPCDRQPEADKAHCPFRAIEKECRLFFRP